MSLHDFTINPANLQPLQSSNPSNPAARLCQGDEAPLWRAKSAVFSDKQFTSPVPVLSRSLADWNCSVVSAGYNLADARPAAGDGLANV